MQSLPSCPLRTWVYLLSSIYLYPCPILIIFSSYSNLQYHLLVLFPLIYISIKQLTTISSSISLEP